MYMHMHMHIPAARWSMLPVAHTGGHISYLAARAYISACTCMHMGETACMHMGEAACMYHGMRWERLHACMYAMG